MFQEHTTPFEPQLTDLYNGPNSCLLIDRILFLQTYFTEETSSGTSRLSGHIWMYKLYRALDVQVRLGVKLKKCSGEMLLEYNQGSVWRTWVLYQEREQQSPGRLCQRAALCLIPRCDSC